MKEVTTEQQVLGDLRDLITRVLAYDKAISECPDNPEKMSSFCTAQGDDLDTLYAAWKFKAEELDKKYNKGENGGQTNSDGTPT